MPSSLPTDLVRPSSLFSFVTCSERVVNTSRSRLEEVNVPGLQPGKKYSLRVAAFNELGAGASTVSLEVETLVEPHVLQAPSNLSVMAVSPVSMMASWGSPDLGSGSHGHLPIQNYKLFYMEVGSAEEHEVVTSHTSHLIHGLKPYTEYSVWVVAFNNNGPGTSTEEATAKTWSDVPSDTPQNVIAEPASSSVICSKNHLRVILLMRFFSEHHRKMGSSFCGEPERNHYRIQDPLQTQDGTWPFAIESRVA